MLRRALSRLADTVVTGVQRDPAARARVLARLSDLQRLLATLPPASAHVQATAHMVAARLASGRAPLLESEPGDASCELLESVIEDEIALLRDTFADAQSLGEAHV